MTIKNDEFQDKRYPKKQEDMEIFKKLKSKEAIDSGIKEMLYQILKREGIEPELEKLREDNGENEIYYDEIRKNQPDGLFQLDLGEVTHDTVKVFHEINPKLNHIQTGDKIVALHIKANTLENNPQDEKPKELMVNGMKRVRDYVRGFSEEKRPKYFIFYSHLSPKMAEIYGFDSFSVPEDIKKANGAYKYMLSPSAKVFWGKEKNDWENKLESKEIELQDNSLSQEKKNENNNEIKKAKKRIELAEKHLEMAKEYTTDHIQLIMAPIEQLLSISDEKFEELKKPSNEEGPIL